MSSIAYSNLYHRFFLNSRTFIQLCTFIGVGHFISFGNLRSRWRLAQIHLFISITL
ncbi:hypothetical protein GCK32_002328, partial [Trichostrongylus colubriformis]